MANDTVTLTYIHDHECSRKGEEFTYRPICSQGVAHDIYPVCIELMQSLTFERVEKI